MIVNREVCNISVNLNEYDYLIDECIIGEVDSVGTITGRTALHFRPHEAGVHIFSLKRA